MLDDAAEDWNWVFKRKGISETMRGRTMGSWDDYFPSVVVRVAERLQREGDVQIKETPEGTKVAITEKGRRRVLMFKLRELGRKDEMEKWDGRWRMIFFDVAEVDRGKRDGLRKYLKQLGLKQMQESVWVTPWEVRDEVKYLREILGVPHAVKWGILVEIENEKDLKEWFELK